MRENAQMRRQLEPAEISQAAYDEQHRIEPDAARPSERGGERDELPGIEAFHANA
jgi:hypothetical protein